MDIEPLSIPELTTFGALIRHALALEGFAVELYKALSQNHQDDSEASRIFDDLAKQHRARQQLLERTRREKLSEMILEPIEGLDGWIYVPAVGARPGTANRPAETGSDDEMSLARELEEICARFYLDSARAARMVLAEVGKVFERLAQENKKNSEIFASL